MGECPGEPPKRLRPTLTHLPAGEVIYRIHDARFGAFEFNPGHKGQGRFHPIDDSQGRPVPSLYGALDFETALCEALFRGRPRGGSIPAKRVRELSRSLLRSRRELTLVNLYAHGLHAIGAEAPTLIESPQRCYPATSCWAEALYGSASKAHGMIWRSRQRPYTDALILWQPRIPEPFEVLESSSSLASPTFFQRVFEVARLQEITVTVDDT